MSTTTSIQNLDTSVDPPRGCKIHAVITLLWPYSSSTRQCALLLSERDFRLRAKGGQIRVKFSGPAARAIAEQRLGIGDQVILDVENGEWAREEGGAAIHMPGKSVGELHFGKGVRLRVQKDAAADVEVNVAEDAVEEIEKEDFQSHATPVKQISGTASARSSLGSAAAGAAIYSSPAFMRRAAKFSYLDGISRLFEDEWESQDLPRKKARISIGEVREWKVVDRTPSPERHPSEPPNTELEEAATTHEFSGVTGDATESQRLQIEQEGPLAVVQSDQPSPKPESMHPEPDAILQSRVEHESVPSENRIGASTVEEVPIAADTANPIFGLPQLHLPSMSPTRERSQGEDLTQISADPVTPRLQPLSSAALPSTTPQISPLATKNASRAHSNERFAEITEAAPSVQARPEGGVEHFHPSLRQGQNAPTLLDGREHADNKDASDSESSDASEASEHPALSDAQNDDILTAQNLNQTVGLDSNSEAEVDDVMSDLEREEEDDLMMDEDDAEAVFDADELDGSEPSDDEDDEDVEMQDPSHEGHELPGDSEEIIESDVESEGQQSPHSPIRGDVDLQSGSTTSEQPGFAPASTLLSNSESVAQNNGSADAFNADVSTTPSKKPALGLDRAVPSTEVTPNAKPTHSPKKTPQSAKDRAMKRTLQRLFGLKGTPSPEKEVLAKHDYEQNDVQVDVHEGLAHEQPHEQEPAVSFSNSRAKIDQRAEFAEGTEESQIAASALPAATTPLEPAETIQLDSDDGDEMQDQSRSLDQPAGKPHTQPQQRSTRQSIIQPSPDLARSAEEGTTFLNLSADAPAKAEPLEQSDNSRQEEPAEVSLVSHLQSPTLQEPSNGKGVDVSERRTSEEPTGLNSQSQVVTDELGMQDATMLTPMEVEGSLVQNPGIQESGLFDEFFQIPESFEQPTLSGVARDAQIPFPEDHPEAMEPFQQPDVVQEDRGSTAKPQVSPIMEGINGNTTDLLEQQLQSSPRSFQSQVIEEQLDAHKSPSAEITSRPVSRDSIEAFSPVALGSLSKMTAEAEGHDGQVTNTPRMEIDDQVQHAEATPQLQSNDAKNQGLEYAEPTPTHTEKEITVVDLESSPSEPQEPTAAEIAREAVSQEATPQLLQAVDNQSTVVPSESSIAAGSPNAQMEHDAQARDDQLKENFTLNEPPSDITDPVKEHPSKGNSETAPVALEHSEHLGATLDPSLLPSDMSEMHLPCVDTTKVADVPTSATSQPQPIMQTQLSETETTQAFKASQADTHSAEKASMQPPQPQAPTTPARRSLRSRLSNVPDVISAWFSPKRSSIAAQEPEKAEAPAQPAASTAEVADKSQSAKVHAQGISTTHGYFTSLCALNQHLNPSSQQAYGSPGVVDILAVVTDFTKEPERAKGGPRDYYTIFRVTDPSMPSSHVRVEVFRPWKAVLPAAAVGDVVLLRAFVVKSKKRQSYLLSTDTSGWCVWRFAELGDSAAPNDSTESEKPAWARRRSHSDVREEIKGPPVEYGSAEKEQARKLREWWLERQLEIQNGKPGESKQEAHGNEASAAML